MTDIVAFSQPQTGCSSAKNRIRPPVAKDLSQPVQEGSKGPTTKEIEILSENLASNNTTVWQSGYRSQPRCRDEKSGGFRS